MTASVNLPGKIEPRACFRAASLLPTGALPKGDPRIWSHTLTDLVAGALRDGRVGNIREAGGAALSAERVETALARLTAAGVEAGEVVLVETRNTLVAAETLLALWLIGCAVCPVDPEAPQEVKSMLAREAEAAATVGPEGEVTLHTERPKRGSTIRLVRPKRITGCDLALVVFTSGSSGAAKGVLLTHANVMAALRGVSAYLKLQPDDRILCVPPLFFDYGLYQLLLALFNDCELLLNGRETNAVAVVKLIERLRPTVLPVVPALGASLARLQELAGAQAPSVRLITNTGGHLPEPAIAAMRATFPNAKVMPMYGLTESKRALYLDTDVYPHARGAVGRPMPGLAAKVAVEGEDANLREAAPFETGELYVRGGSVMQGYHRETSGAGARLVAGDYRDDNWLATGDLFSVDLEGLFTFRGRAKALVKQGGHCVHPRDVEDIAERHAEVAAARAIGRMESSGDESLVLFVQSVRALDAAARKRVVSELKAAMPKTLTPRAFRFLDRFPATANGKIDAAALAALDLAACQPSVESGT